MEKIDWDISLAITFRPHGFLIQSQHPMATHKSNEKLGRYEILSELGQGAMGVVYKAIDPLIDRTVAIKTINLDLSKDELANFEERFYREAKSAGRLNHPNIVTIYDVGKTGNVAYMAMEFLEGQSLKEILDVHTALSVDQIANIAAQVAHALEYAHKNGVVHRDIKPANIMLVHGGMAKITDFGIAQMPTGSKTLAGTVLGSPKYMAPEQVLGTEVDGRADLFSLGVVLYEMLTGESPFNGDNINSTMYRIVNETPAPPTTIVPRIPAAFNLIVAKALAKNPDERYQTAKDLAYDLRHYKDNGSTSTTTEPDQAKTAKRQPRPKNDVGEATVLLSPASAQLINKRAISGNARAMQAKTNANGFFDWQNKNSLIAVIMILLLIFTFLVLRGRSTHQEEKVALSKPVVPPAAPGPSPGVAAPKIEVAVNDNSLNSELLKTEPIAPQPKILRDPAKTPRNAEPHKSLKHEIVQTEAATSVPLVSEPTGEALLSFAITPWGEVYIDGKKIGAAPPLKELKIPAGRHTIEIRNTDFPAYSKVVDLQADSTKKIKYIFK